MTSDSALQQAREHHRRSLELEEQAAAHRLMRNQLVRRLRAEDPQRWSYGRLAKAIGCTPELIAAIVKKRVP